MKKKSAVIGIILCIALVLGCGIWYMQVKKPHDDAAKEFNAAAQEVNNKNDELTKEMNDAQKIVDEKSPVYDETTAEALVTTLADAKANMRKVPELPKDTDDIKAETKKLSEPLDYSAVIKDISDKQLAYQNSIQQMKQITNPSEDFIIQRLQGIPNISGYQPVTEDNDPNGQLNKQGGYTATVYFSSPLVDQSIVSGSDIVERGTDGGGAIEVYSTVEEAEARDSYLASFDSMGALSSGSHKVLGTILIRTSNYLTATQQNELTANIVNALLELK